jgi:hypothetical protein
MWPLTSDHAHCILKFVIIKQPTTAIHHHVWYIQLQPRFTRAKESRSFQYWNELLLSSYLVTHTYPRSLLVIG